MLKCNVNGKDIEVKEGTSVIQAFKQAGEDIAHYCYHEGLSVAGVCRLCMIEVEGNPRLQIACNTQMTEGMVVSNQTDKVKDTVKWGLDFHLINHPLDCPICDQAGECQLQIQYMKFGQYEPEMAEKKVKKHKVVDLGPTVVLDTERCILCSRCVRFTDEVSKTNELGIFNRGDRSEIGTFKGKPLSNNYSLNTVDICPVGALTSKDFRFRQRVWYLKDSEGICTGCSTGCNVKYHYNEDGLFRVKPVHNEEVNGYWMCDKGRDSYKWVNVETRLVKAKVGQKSQWESQTPGGAAKFAGEKLRDAAKKAGPQAVALVLTGQNSCEEYESLLSLFVDQLGSKNIFYWKNNPESFESFDDLLLRGDKNPNTKGLLDALGKKGVSSQWSDLENQLNAGTIQTLVVVGPENIEVYPDAKEKVSLFEKSKELVFFTSSMMPTLDEVATPTWQIPMKTFAEKPGSYVNYQGKTQKMKAFVTLVKGALNMSEASQLLSGEDVGVEMVTQWKVNKTNHFAFNHGGGV